MIIVIKNDNDDDLKKMLKYAQFCQLCIEDESFTSKIGPSYLLVSKIYFIRASRINLLLLKKQVQLS